jgi:hypothetical protein
MWFFRGQRDQWSQCSCGVYYERIFPLPPRAPPGKKANKTKTEVKTEVENLGSAHTKYSLNWIAPYPMDRTNRKPPPGTFADQSLQQEAA